MRICLSWFFFFCWVFASMLLAWLFWWENEHMFWLVEFLVLSFIFLSFWFLQKLIPNQELIQTNPSWKIFELKSQVLLQLDMKLPIHRHIFFSFAVCFWWPLQIVHVLTFTTQNIKTNNHNPWSCIFSIGETELEFINISLYFNSNHNRDLIAKLFHKWNQEFWVIIVGFVCSYSPSTKWPNPTLWRKYQQKTPILFFIANKTVQMWGYFCVKTRENTFSCNGKCSKNAISSFFLCVLKNDWFWCFFLTPFSWFCGLFKKETSNKHTQQKQNWCWMSWKTTKKKGALFLVTQTNKNKVFENVYTIKHSTDKKKSTKKTDFETPNFNERKDTKIWLFCWQHEKQTFASKGGFVVSHNNKCEKQDLLLHLFLKKRKLCVDRSPFSQHSSWKKRHPNPTKWRVAFCAFFPSFLLRKKETLLCPKKFPNFNSEKLHEKNLIFFGVGKHLWNKSLRENFSNAERKIGKVSVFFLPVNSRRFYWTKWPKQQKKCQRKSTKRLPNKVLKEAYFCKNTKKWHSIHHFHSNNLLWKVKYLTLDTLSQAPKNWIASEQLPTTKFYLRVIFFVWKK